MNFRHEAARTPINPYRAPVIEFIDDLPNGCIGARAIGNLTLDDYSTSIEPLVDSIIEQHAQLRLILHLGDAFDGFGEGAWGHLTDEIRHVRFHRGAVVTNDGHISGAVNVLKWTLHGHVRTFHNDEYQNAVHWIAT